MLRWLKDNLGALVLAFTLAVMVWFVVAREINPMVEQAFDEFIPVQLLNQPAWLVFTNTGGTERLSRPPERRVQVVVRGPKQLVDLLQVEDFSAVVDLGAVSLHGTEAPIEIKVDESLADLVEIVEQDLESIYLRLEPFRSETFAIQPLVTGSPALGHVAGTAVVQPAEITLEGPASLIDPVQLAQVRVSIRDEQETVRDVAQVVLRDANGRQLTGFSAEDLVVSVTVPITKSDEYAELFVTVDLTGTLASGFRLADFTVDPQRVTIFGAPKVVSALPGFVSTTPVDVSGADSDLIQRVGLNVPEGVTLIGAQNVVVEIDVEPVVTTLTFPWRPRIFGPDPGLTATISLDMINVSMIGPLALIDSFNPETDLSLSLNLYGLDPGAYKVAPSALSNVPGVVVENILPSSILVEIFLIPTPTPTPTPTGTLTVTTSLTSTLVPSPLATPTVTATPTAVQPPTATPTAPPEP